MKPSWKVAVVLLTLSVPLTACDGLSPAKSETLSASGVVEAVEVQVAAEIAGRITEVLMAESDAVEAGEPLFRLDDESLQIQRRQISAAGQATQAASKLELISAQQALDDLHEDSPLILAQAQLDLAIARDELDDMEKKWRNQQEGQRGSSTTVRAAEAELALAKDAMEAAERQANKFSSDDPEHAQDYKNYAAAVQRYRLALSSLNWYTGHPTEIQQGLLDAEVAIAETRVEQAELEWEKWKEGPDPDDVALAEARLSNAQAQVAAAEATLRDLELVAPFDGTIASVTGTTGEMAGPGQPAIVLADFSSWLIETDNLTEIELPKVGVGQQVLVNFDALSDVELDGTVTAIKPLFELRQGDVTYVVTISLDEDDPRLQWGMTAVVTFEDTPLATD